jgi:hypothetical protein
MRFAPLALFAILVASLPAQAQVPLIGESDLARTSGVYASFTAPDAAACAQICSRDSICMAWTYRSAARGCALGAVVAAPISEAGARSGLSARAPTFSRQMQIALGPAPVLDPPPHEETPAQAADTELLGGPPPGAAIRPRLGE